MQGEAAVNTTTSFSTSSSLIINCFLLLLNPKVDWHTYRLIAEWFGAYTYILPAERKVLPTLPTALFNYLCIKYNEQVASDTIFHIVRSVNTNLSYSNQIDLLALLKQELKSHEESISKSHY